MPFSCLGKKRAKRSRVKGVAERSESTKAMPAGGRHTIIQATGKSFPVAVPGIFVGGKHLPHLPTAATRSGRSSRHWRRSHRSPFTIPRRTAERTVQDREKSDRMLQLHVEFRRIRRMYCLIQILTAPPPRRREGYIGEGAFARSASPMPLSLVTFLCGHKKVTRSLFICPINCNL